MTIPEILAKAGEILFIAFLIGGTIVGLVNAILHMAGVL